MKPCLLAGGEWLQSFSIISLSPIFPGVPLECRHKRFDVRLMKGIVSSRMTTREKKDALDLLQGTLDLLILQTLASGRAHGHAIAYLIGMRSDDVLQVGHGSLYPALQRLLKLDLIAVEDGISENNRKARFYRLTPKGRKKLFTETSRWERFSAAVTAILAPPSEENS